MNDYRNERRLNVIQGALLAGALGTIFFVTVGLIVILL